MPYHMFFGFNLRNDVRFETAQRGLDELTDALVAANVMQSTSTISKRDRHPVLDTASNINSEYFTTMTFADRKEADAAVKLIYARIDTTDRPHESFIEMVDDPFFLCFYDEPL